MDRQEPSLLPRQAAPVARRTTTGGAGTGPGVTAADNVCKDLTGLAQQMCYASIYKV